jgi:hypothetical protein
LYKKPSIRNLRGKRIDAVLEKVIQMYYNIYQKGAFKMPKKNSSTKAVRSFRLSLECVRQLKDLSGNMGRSEGDVVEVSIDRMYREEIRFGNLMISEGQKPEDNYNIGKQEG